MRFIEEMSQPEIAEELGISQSYVSRIIRGALTGLRAAGWTRCSRRRPRGGSDRHRWAGAGPGRDLHRTGTRGRGAGTYDKEPPWPASDPLQPLATTGATLPLQDADRRSTGLGPDPPHRGRRRPHRVGRRTAGPTEEEERLAEEAGEVDPEVADHYREMAERGADVQGEGQITP